MTFGTAHRATITWGHCIAVSNYLAPLQTAVHSAVCVTEPAILKRRPNLVIVQELDDDQEELLAALSHLTKECRRRRQQTIKDCHA